MAIGVLAPEQRIGSYTLLEKLGAGGLGEVWKARDRRLNRVVALKFVKTERHGSTAPADLLREARAASALNHPNIVWIFEVGEADQTTYIAMEFVEGETLRQRLARSGVSIEEAVEIATQTARGLAAAHRHGIVHRDLKPENIMLRADGYVKLVDFGLAKALSWSQGESSGATVENITESGEIVGTLTYMSPEQARGRTVTPASDVFSFGIVFYELLAGVHPFQADTPMDTIGAILNREPADVCARNHAVSRETGEIVKRALRKEPTERFSSAVEITERLERTRTTKSPSKDRSSKPVWVKALGMSLVLVLLLLAAWMLSSLSVDQAASAVRSLAVMNFRTDADDLRAELLARGLPEDLGGALSRRGLSVAARSSVLELGSASHARTLGTQLGVDAVVEGTVRSYGSKFKVHIEIVSTRTGFQIWSGTFLAAGDDVLGSEQKTAAEIATQVQSFLAGQKP